MWRRRQRASHARDGEHGQAMDDLQGKDEEIDDLLSAARKLTADLRQTVTDASAQLRASASRTEGDHASG